MSEFIYLISSLPLLREGEPPPFSADDFVRRCADWLSPAELDALTDLQLLPPDLPPDLPPHPAVAAWHAWETDLRNRVAGIREAAVQRDPEADRHEAGPACFPGNERIVQEAFAAPDPRERERLLDHARWRRLDDLETSWSFGFDRLCIYKLRLLLAAPWPQREPAAGRQAVDTLVDRIYRRQETPDATAA